VIEGLGMDTRRIGVAMLGCRWFLGSERELARGRGRVELEGG